MLVDLVVELEVPVEPTDVPLVVAVPAAAPVGVVEPVVALVVPVDPELAFAVAAVALVVELVVAAVAPYRPGSFPSGAETAPCVTAEAFGLLE